MVASGEKVWVAQRRTSFLNNKRLPTLEISDETYKQYEHELSVKANLNDAVKYLYSILRNYEAEMDCLDVQDDAQIGHFEATSEKIVLLLWKLTEFCTDSTNIQHASSLKLIKDFCGKTNEERIICGNIGSFLRELKAGTLDSNKRQRYSKASQRCIDDLLTLFKDLDSPYVHAFFSDFSRISFSSAFRRLQDKAQVFPLEKHDYARTRLTHTIEVMSISMQLANLTALKIGYSISNIEKKELAFLFEKCLNCAALLHDMGNPPYGHFGEDAIKDYFTKKWNELVLYTSSGAKHICDLPRSVSDNVYEQMKQDFLCFDGNAQSFRLASRTAQYKIGKSLDLTAAVLGSIIKYPCNSVEGKKHRKFGYFYSEMDTIGKLGCMGTYQHNIRNPLAMLLEAADDISYVTSDLIDAIRKNALSYERFHQELLSESTPEVMAFRNSFDAFFQENLDEDIPFPFEYTMQRMINDLKISLWGAINLLEGYGNDNPGAKSQGIKQLMAGGGVALIGITLVPLLSGLFG